MNTNSNAKTILCYGDSNTWGQKPDKSGRYAADARWTGRVQKLLGDNCYIIEEGLSSRTTDLDYPKRPGRNGRTYLEPCLDSHNPLDLVIVMLGTNDLKLEFNRSSEDIAKALNGLVEIIQERGKNALGATPKILLISPILVDDTAPNFAEFYTGYYNHDSAAKSKELAVHIQSVADNTNSLFLDAAKVASAGDDGLHFNFEAHVSLGEILSSTINRIFA